ncbi:GNAT family N-acetyltransferase [Pelosinus sp. Bkl1]|uniref:GNAT family N-acetyltransferase n=1 Tax=Pelosinus baikalensis TaxID=2892015 RepID=A0ABS8I0T3_9FIRM|nr:GNAT family N-acetyltransferase [Pelosinus baikalensis]
MKDADNQILGGIIAFISNYWGRCSIDILWIEEKYRNLGYGSQLLRTIEEIAIKKNCNIITLNTASFQAPKFYIKQGYELYGILRNFPTEEHSEYSFKKTLTNTF